MRGHFGRIMHINKIVVEEKLTAINQIVVLDQSVGAVRITYDKIKRKQERLTGSHGIKSAQISR